MILDSNIVIYAAQPEHAFLRDMMLDRSVSVSVITRWIPSLHVINPFEDYAVESGATAQ